MSNQFKTSVKSGPILTNGGSSWVKGRKLEGVGRIELRGRCKQLVGELVMHIRQLPEDFIPVQVKAKISNAYFQYGLAGHPYLEDWRNTIFFLIHFLQFVFVTY